LHLWFFTMHCLHFASAASPPYKRSWRYLPHDNAARLLRAPLRRCLPSFRRDYPPAISLLAKTNGETLRRMVRITTPSPLPAHLAPLTYRTPHTRYSRTTYRRAAHHFSGFLSSRMLPLTAALVCLYSAPFRLAYADADDRRSVHATFATHTPLQLPSWHAHATHTALDAPCPHDPPPPHQPPAVVTHNLVCILGRARALPTWFNFVLDHLLAYLPHTLPALLWLCTFCPETTAWWADLGLNILLGLSSDAHCWVCKVLYMAQVVHPVAIGALPPPAAFTHTPHHKPCCAGGKDAAEDPGFSALRRTPATTPDSTGGHGVGSANTQLAFQGRWAAYTRAGAPLPGRQPFPGRFGYWLDLYMDTAQRLLFSLTPPPPPPPRPPPDAPAQHAVPRHVPLYMCRPTACLTPPTTPLPIPANLYRALRQHITRLLCSSRHIACWGPHLGAFTPLQPGRAFSYRPYTCWRAFTHFAHQALSPFPPAWFTAAWTPVQLALDPQQDQVRDCPHHLATTLCLPTPTATLPDGPPGCGV